MVCLFKYRQFRVSCLLMQVLICFARFASVQLQFSTPNRDKNHSNELMRHWKERSVLFNDALNTFYFRLYGVRRMVKDHSDSERGNPLPPHRLLFSISSKGSFICTIPQTGYHVEHWLEREIKIAELMRHCAVCEPLIGCEPRTYVHR